MILMGWRTLCLDKLGTGRKLGKGLGGLACFSWRFFPIRLTRAFLTIGAAAVRY